MRHRFAHRLLLTAAMVIGWASVPFAQEYDIQRDYIGISLPTPEDPRVPIQETPSFRGLHLDGARSPFLTLRISGFKRIVELDSTGTLIRLDESIDGIPLGLPAIMPRDEYLRVRGELELQRMWQKSAGSGIGSRTYGRQGAGQGIRIDIPVEIKSKAFQKIFGSGTVGLDVSGDISIRGGFRHEKRSEVKTAFNRGSDYNFKMEQTQRFRVQGHIGDKVTIGIDQDSERAFDFENNIKLKYEGYEDEIIQSIEAGNIALSLPGTQFVTFGGKSSGLFGIKTEARIGNLQLTAIASQEKGEKKKLSLSGGASQQGERREDYQYRQNTYYFIDHFYRNQYLDRDENGNFLIDPGRIVQKLEVYVSQPGLTNEADVVRGWAIVPPDIQGGEWQITPGDTAKVDRNHYVGYFRRLEKSDYYVDNELGFIRLRTPLQQEVLAIAYRDSSGRVRGEINFDGAVSKTITLRLLKTETPLDTDQTWDLEWKNVYYLGSRDIPADGFDLKIYYKPPSGDPQEDISIGGKTYTFLQIFGLDRVNESGEAIPDNKVDMNPNIINLTTGELFFPDIQPFDPLSEEYRALLPEDYRVPAIYDTTASNVITSQSNFYIEIKSQNRSSEYRLGMNIIENSEDVRLNGRTLTRGVDYTIDYFTGTLRLLNEEATLPSANLDVTYESNQLFQIDKKTVIGARAEYALWDESFIGATFMYLNETTLDQKVRVGRGPMRNMIWDVNTSLSIKPFFLTRFANFLPFVDTREPSSLRFEGEIAQVLPNPNTKNNPMTGDNDGVAYIDDFEASKQLTPFSIVQQSWNYCAPPLYGRSFNPDSPTLEKRARMIYYNPYEQYPIKWIKPNQDVNANVAQTTNILVFKIQPPDSIPDVHDGWNGVQMALSSGYWNQSEAKFLEVWVKGDSGVLHFDLGEITEDIIPNGKLDTEDRMKNGIRNGILDEGEDTGMEGMAGKDPSDFWDLNGNGVRDWGEPISWDDWKYDSSVRPINYDRVNGTEGNANDYGGRYPDTEDLNRNGQLDQNNDYFEYSFSLDKNSPDAERYLVGGLGLSPDEDYGWRQYRIPLDEFTSKVGNPTLSLVKYVRIWMDGFETAAEHTVQIAYVDLVSSEWKEIGIAGLEAPEDYELTEEPPVTVTVVNTHDNPDYIPPPGVAGEQD
ncbi:cell surface protein SprA, partial [candidate division KSB1 bacterium]|nr:cell surface protein SprA [candidate division KSB1 bacterium]